MRLAPTSFLNNYTTERTRDKMKHPKEMSMEEFFKETFSEDFLKEADVEYTLAQIAGRAFQAKEESGLSFRKIAEKMGLKTSAVVQRIVQEAEPHNVTLATLVRFGQACGFKLNVKFEKADKFKQWIPVTSCAPQYVPELKHQLQFNSLTGASQGSRLEGERKFEFVLPLDGIAATAHSQFKQMNEQPN